MELSIYGFNVPRDELGGLTERVEAALPGAALAEDAARVLRIWGSGRGYEPAPPSERDVLRVGQPGPEVVALVLSTATAVVVEAVADAAREWLRSLLPRPRRERSVVLYGPDGEPLRNVRLRRDADEPETLEQPWPRPER